MIQFSKNILDILTSAKSIFWGGKNPIRFDMVNSTQIYDPHSSFRLPSSYHQEFDVVFLLEEYISSFKQWPLILDEALRLLQPNGVLVIRIQENNFISIFELIYFLEKWGKGNLLLEDEIIVGPDITLVLRFNVKERRCASLESFAFGMITDGRKPANVLEFVKSVLAIDNYKNIHSQIFICGPESVLADLDDFADKVFLVKQPQKFSNKAWVTRKKNLLVKAAKFKNLENIVIVHDRYKIAKDFILRLQDFGGDFDVLIPGQLTERGERIPDWVTLGVSTNWTPPGWLDYGDYHPFIYVNGGAIVAKTETLATTGWSDLLFWAQAEDVELTRRLQDKGITPRLAKDVKLITGTMRPEFVSSFERIPWYKDHYPLTNYTNSFEMRWLKIKSYSLGNVINLDKTAAITMAERQGAFFDSRWEPIQGGISWIEKNAACLSFKVSGPCQNLELLLTGIGNKPPIINGISVNAVPINMDSSTILENTLSIFLPADILPSNNLIHISLHRLRNQEINLSKIKLQHASLNAAEHFKTYKFGELIETNSGNIQNSSYIGAGWYGLEPWGIWSAQEESEIKILLPEINHSGFNFTVTMQAFTPPSLPAQMVSITVNGIGLGATIFYPESGQKTTTVFIPNELISTQCITIGFKVLRLTSPIEANISADNRPLGIGLINFMVSPR